MCKRFYIFTQWMAGILMMLAIVACQETIDDEEYGKPADHTLLMYLIGDNDLSEELGRNVTDASNAIRDSIADGKLNLLVYKDNKKSGDHLPRLYRIHSTESLELEEEVLESWDDEVDSCDPVFMAEVIKTAFSRFNTTLKGMSIGSHAMGWIPPEKRTYNSPRRDAIGPDEDTPNHQHGYIDIWELRQALEQCPKLDYIIMDCCNMGNAEVAYELRGVTRYLVASVTEVQGKGMPYDNVVTRLSKCKNTKDLPKALDYCAQCYFKDNGGNATLSVYDLNSMDNLADSYRQLVDSNRDRLAELNEADGPAIDKWLSDFQLYGRNFKNSRYYFCDIDDVITWMGTQNPRAATDALNARQEVVLSEYHSERFGDNTSNSITIDHSCGMAVSLPEVLHLADDHDLGYGKYFGNLRADNLKAAYHLTAWGNKMGY